MIDDGTVKQDGVVTVPGQDHRRSGNLRDHRRAFVRAPRARCPTAAMGRPANNSLSHTCEPNMTDPRNIAHDKKVQQEKKHRNEEVAPGGDATPQPGKKTHMEHHASDVAKVPDEAASEGKVKD